MISRRLRLAASTLACVVLAGCHAAPTPLTPAQSAALHPADPALARLYDRSCRSCHTIRDSGAPLAGDHSQWDRRWEQGLPTLLQHAVAGFNAMPAGGQCPSCTAADYEKLIRFMAGHEDKSGQ